MIDKKDLDLLGQFADADCTEVGEVAARLLNLYQTSTDYLNQSFVVALEEEVRCFLDDFKENWELVEEVKTYTRKEIVLKEKTK